MLQFRIAVWNQISSVFGSVFRGGDCRHVKQATIFSTAFVSYGDGLDRLEFFWVMLIKQNGLWMQLRIKKKTARGADFFQYLFKMYTLFFSKMVLYEINLIKNALVGQVRWALRVWSQYNAMEWNILHNHLELLHWKILPLTPTLCTECDQFFS